MNFIILYYLSLNWFIISSSPSEDNIWAKLFEQTLSFCFHLVILSCPGDFKWKAYIIYCDLILTGYSKWSPAQDPHPLWPVQRSPSCPGPDDRWILHGGCRAPEDHSQSCIYHQRSPPFRDQRETQQSLMASNQRHPEIAIVPVVWGTSKDFPFLHMDIFKFSSLMLYLPHLKVNV